MNQLSKQLAYDLTIEFVQKNNYLKCSYTDIPKQIEEVVKISNTIYDEINKHSSEFKIL